MGSLVGGLPGRIKAWSPRHSPLWPGLSRPATVVIGDSQAHGAREADLQKTWVAQGLAGAGYEPVVLGEGGIGLQGLREGRQPEQGRSGPGQGRGRRQRQQGRRPATVSLHTNQHRLGHPVGAAQSRGGLAGHQPGQTTASYPHRAAEESPQAGPLPQQGPPLTGPYVKRPRPRCASLALDDASKALTRHEVMTGDVMGCYLGLAAQPGNGSSNANGQSP